jgi:hypothetical protein
MDYPHDSEWYVAYYRHCSALKVWNSFVASCPPLPEYKRSKLRHATEKGIPVSGLRSGRGGCWKPVNGHGVSAGSHVLSHRYACEGDKGTSVRREVRRKEDRLWRKEVERENLSEAACSVAEWFMVDPYAWDFYYGEDDYDSFDLVEDYEIF